MISPPESAGVPRSSVSSPSAGSVNAAPFGPSAPTGFARFTAMTLTALAPLLGAFAIALWWSGRGLDGDAARQWLNTWQLAENLPLVVTAAPSALFLSASIVAVLSWTHGGTRRAIAVSARAAAALLLAPALLLIPDPLARGVYASAALAAFVWFQHKPAGPIPQRPAVTSVWLTRWRDHGHWVLAAICLLALGSFAQARHNAHWTSLIDLGLFFEQYHNPEGRLLYSPTLGMSFLGEHFSPILVLLWPLLKLWPDPSALLWTQALSLSAAGLVLHRLALVRTGNVTFAQVLLVAWCLNPWVQQAAFYDFHMDMLEAPFLFGACLAAMTRRNLALWLCAIGLWLTKEDTFIYTSAIAFWLMLQPERRRLGAALFAAGILQAGVLLAFVLPALRPPFDPSYFSTTGATEAYAFLGRYSHLGETPSAIIQSLVTNPFYVLSHVLSGDQLPRAISLVAGFGGLALLGRWRWLWLAPAGEMLIANPGPMSHFQFYYGAVVVPFAAIAAVEGFRTLTRRSPAPDEPDAQSDQSDQSDQSPPQQAERSSQAPIPFAQRRAIAALALSAGLALFLHPSSRFAAETDFQDYARSARHARIDEALSQIPKGARVAATGYLAVRLQRHHTVTMLPYGVDEAEWLALDLQRPAWPSQPAAVQALVLRLVQRGEWTVHHADDSLFFLIQRTPQENQRADAALPPNRAQAPPAAADAWHGLFEDFTLQAELSERSHYLGRFKRDPNASNGRYLSVAATDSRGPGHALWGPYFTLRPRPYEVTFALRWAPGGRRAQANTPVATIDVFCREGVVAQRDISAEDFANAGASHEWTQWTIVADLSGNARACESRVYYHDRGTLDVDAVRWALVPN